MTHRTRTLALTLGLLATTTTLACGASSDATSETASSTASSEQALATTGSFRVPRGLYAKVGLHDVTAPAPALDWTDYLQCLYANLLANPAISGIQLGFHWDDLNPSKGVYAFGYVQAAFDAANSWNTQHPTDLKNISFVIAFGFDSPAWLDLKPCDPLMTGGNMPVDCGSITFQGYMEPDDSSTLPLPWNAMYKNQWHAFIAALASSFGGATATSGYGLLSSVTIAGPTAATSEMFVPSNDDTPSQIFPQTLGVMGSHQNDPGCTTGVPCCQQALQKGSACMLPVQIWEKLFQNHYTTDSSYWQSNKAFVEEWEDAISFFDDTFQNTTLILTTATGHGFLDLSAATDPWPQTPYTNKMCAGGSNESCNAGATIVSDFVAMNTGKNAKAVQTSGLMATPGSDSVYDGNISLVHYIAASTLGSAAPVIGGAMFNHPFSDVDNSHYLADGCFGVTTACATSTCAGETIPPEQEELAVLSSFFDQTTAETTLGPVPSGTSGTAAMNYIQVDYRDVQYAEATPGKQPAYNTPACGTSMASAQTMLNEASVAVFSTASPSAIRTITGKVPAPAACVPPALPCDGACTGGEQYCDRETNTCKVLCGGSQCI